MQDGVAPASKAPNQLAQHITVKRLGRAKLKAQEQVLYELLKRKASHVTVSPAEAATTVGRHKVSQGGTAHTVAAADAA